MSLWLRDAANGLASLPVASRVAGQSLTSEKGETPADRQQALTAKPQGRASSVQRHPPRNTMWNSATLIAQNQFLVVVFFLLTHI